MKTITVNVFNVTSTDENNYMHCITMPNYKQMGRTINWLRQYVKEQGANDFNFRRMVFYVFQANMWEIK